MNTRVGVGRSITMKAVAVTCALAMTGCASPIVRWNVSDTAKDRPQTLAYARAYAMAARDAYRDQIATQFDAANNLGSGLIGLGAIVAGLAAGSAHRDAILGGALLGGTAYTLGQWNLRPQRLLIYQAGVEGINCALAAIIPVAMSDADRADLDRRIGTVEDLSRLLTADLNVAVRALTENRADLTDADVNGFNSVRDAARAALASAQGALPPAHALSTKAARVGPELIVAVDRIAASVDKALQATLPDLSSVPKIVGSLAETSGSFAPGSTVGTTLTEALKNAISTKAAALDTLVHTDTKRVSARAKVVPFFDKVEADTANLVTELAALQSRVAAADSSATLEALKSCGVTDIPVNLKVSAEKLSFAQGKDETQTLVISGGNKPYVVDWAAGPEDGLTAKQPVPWESRAQIAVTKAAASGKFTLLVMDSSAKMQTQTVAVEIGTAQASPASPDTGKAKTTSGDTASPLQRIVTALNAKSQFSYTSSSGKVYGLAIPAARPAAVGANQSSVELTLGCKPKPAAELTVTSVRTAIVSQLPEDVRAMIDSTQPLGDQNRNLSIQWDATCKPK